MAGKSFDHSRMQDKLYGDLHSPRQAAQFFTLVEEYMAYLRSGPQMNEDWNEAQELETAQKFVEMINNDVGWPLARTAAPEFKITSDTISTVPQPLKYILSSVEARLPQPPLPKASYLSQRQQHEEELQWRKFQAQVRILAHAVGGTMMPSEEREAEVQEVLKTVQMAQDAVKSRK